jgi:hypothetical protein
MGAVGAGRIYCQSGHDCNGFASIFRLYPLDPTLPGMLVRRRSKSDALRCRMAMENRAR